MPENDEQTPGHGALARLRDARPILLAAGLVVVALTVAGFVDPPAAVAIVAAVAAAALMPRRARALSQAGRQRRDRADLSRDEAIGLPLDAMEDAAYLLGADGAVKYQNAAAIERFGRAETDVHISARMRAPAVLDVVREAGEANAPRMVEHAERVPSERWFQVRCAPLAGTSAGDAATRLFLLSFRDMSEARRMDRMRTDFVANASHELRTPLASLTGFIETIQGPARNDRAAQDRFLAIMSEQAGRMTRLVEDLMSLSRIELKVHMAPTGTVDLAQLLTHVCDALRPLARELGVTLHLSGTETPVTIVGERDELIQVFENLVENACKYGQSGERVELALTILGEGAADIPPGGRVAEVVVRDFGPGIAPEHLPRLTERFYRIDSDESRAKKGTGLGLAIVKHILTRHRTRLVIRSTQGEGSSFIARFPVLRDVENVA